MRMLSSCPGYANEVGESFRALVPVSLVRGSYVVAGLYCLADTYDKTTKTSMVIDLTYFVIRDLIFFVATKRFRSVQDQKVNYHCFGYVNLADFSIRCHSWLHNQSAVRCVIAYLN